MAEPTKQNLIRRAADLLGREELATRLKVPTSLLDSWVNGQATMPDRKLDALTEILDDISGFKR